MLASQVQSDPVQAPASAFFTQCPAAILKIQLSHPGTGAQLAIGEGLGNADLLGLHDRGTVRVPARI
jgi:hypothetical protein